MTGTFTMRLSFMLALLTMGCSSGPMGGPSSYNVPPTRTGAPQSQAPIATQPMMSPTTTSVRVLPFATLPPHASMQAQNGGVRPLAMLASNDQMIDGRSMPFLTRQAQLPSTGGAKPRKLTINTSASSADSSQNGALANGLPPSPNEDLRYRGGRTIQNLTWANVYVGGQAAWLNDDWRNIDKALAGAMTDANLNNVICQYFNNQPLKNTFKGSFFLSGWKPTFVPKTDLERQVSGLYSSGAFAGYDLPNTVFCFMLPKGSVLGDPNAGMAQAPVSNKAVPHEEAEDSTGGLGGYHGSVHVGNVTVYYAVGVYSERNSSTGATNGIPVFDQNWKNVVGTFYHELQEARTDPDVGDAAAGMGPDPSRYLGWTSDSGNEVGDYPIAEAKQLSSVFMEIPLADGSGYVPIQLQYSNAVHGPEGPIPYPHGMEPPPGTKPPVTNPPVNNPPTNNPPVTSDPDLANLVSSWNHLEDFVKKAIVRLANSR
ncbi:MAG: hypothetical protein JWP89_5588 [Schlesneria sp.]|nr:hypothetical protein [Schlesneria sp.]